MRRIRGVLLGAVGGVGLALVASPSAPAAPDAAPAPTIESLIDKLGADGYTDREAAARELATRGTAALAALQRAATHPDPETRARAAAIAERLRRAADAEKLIDPKLVHLDHTNVPLATVVADLRAKTGIPLVLDAKIANPLRPITVHTGDVSAWEAVEAVRAAGGLHEVFHEDLAAMTPASAEETRRKRVSYAGPIQSVAAGVVPIILAEGAGPPLPGARTAGVRVLALPAAFPGNRVVRGAGQVVMNLDVTPLPGIRWDEVLAVRVTRAEDETGRPVVTSHRGSHAAENEFEGNVWFGGGRVVFGGNVYYGDPQPANRPNPRVVPVSLKTDDRAIRFLRVFEGAVVGEITLPNQPLATIENLAKTSGVVANLPYDTRVSLVDYKALPDGRVTIKVRTDTPNPWLMQRAGMRRAVIFGGDEIQAPGTVHTFKFLDAAGRPIPQPLIQTSSMNNDGLRQTADQEYVFPKRPDTGAPTTLVALGSKPVTVEIPFRLRDVPLP
ncbi:hypothetical protein [Fimbriiglobus ruber]|uniref:Uncharacterized protein n=1 Tax=Fimbriiglobus ruber TaxID=1908690 RepID=A0A225DFI1_9BACT|nr:hypothetical protein [Fimbriiglobus ruber]OWK35909.1 hypothetical protein FRUB_08472 [Fimbriiglobus ruber]